LIQRRKRLLEGDSLATAGFSGKNLIQSSLEKAASSSHFTNSQSVLGGVPSSSSKIKNQFNSPLFTVSSPSVATIGKDIKAPSHHLSTGNITNGCGYGGYNYYQGTQPGMRRRTGFGKDVGLSSSTSVAPSYYHQQYPNQYIKENGSDEEQNLIQSQIELRRKTRKTQSRLQNARQAESKLKDLASMFGKMSTLIQSQGETLTKVEDDVEVAMGHVDDGVVEIGKLYEITKGNRSLILKVFGILIFFIIFMRLF